MRRIIRAVYFILVLMRFVFVSIDAYFYSFFFSPVVTLGEPASVHFRPVTRQLHYSSGAYKISWCVMKKRVAVELFQEQSDHSSINPLLVPDHSESNHVLLGLGISGHFSRQIAV